MAKCLRDLAGFPLARGHMVGDADSIGFRNKDFLFRKILVNIWPGDVLLFFTGWDLGHAPF